jgi:YidC/Oxa1 family membrane protein insertase
MPGRPNKALRIAVPLALFLVGLAVPVAVIINTTGRSGAGQQTPTQTPTQAREQARQAPEDDRAPQPPDQAPPAQTQTETETQTKAQTEARQAAGAADVDPGAEAGRPEPQAQAGAAPDYRVRSFAGDPLAESPEPIGGLGLTSPYALQIEFSHLGAGIKTLRLARDFDSVATDREARQGPVAPERHVTIQEQSADSRYMLVPFCVVGVEIDGQLVPMLRGEDDGPAWRQVGEDRPGVFEAYVLDGSGEPLLRVERRYRVETGSHDVIVRQRVENLSGRALSIRWRQFGPVDLFASSGYGGDHRRVRFGYGFDGASDPGGQVVAAHDFLWRRSKLTGSKADRTFPGGQVWPNKRSLEQQYRLVWAGLTNRYFAAVAHPVIDPESPRPDKGFGVVERVDRVLLGPRDAPTGLALSFHSPERSLEPGASASFDMGLYAGPKSKPVIRGHAMLDRLGVAEIVVFNFGGPCAACTFSWLTGPLLGLMRFLHSVTSDWALAVILLVVCVRTLLHPVTRWSQTKMLIFGKQMQNIAPKQKILQERYKDDRQRLQQEMAKLWREEGISPAGFLGCLPMLLQSPVWIALYATLFFAFDLRHQPAFFGVFQAISNNAWPFLADLAEPDRALYFGSFGPTLPLIGKINSINLLPLLLGVVFYIQQKYLTPPPSAAMTPEQEAQQKMIKIMMVVMFPLVMYAAPSGLTLYFITNSVLGIVESRWIRSRAEERGMLEEANLRKKPRKGGFMAKLQDLARRQQELQAQRTAGARGIQKAPKAQTPGPKRFKKKR